MHVHCGECIIVHQSASAQFEIVWMAVSSDVTLTSHCHTFHHKHNTVRDVRDDTKSHNPFRNQHLPVSSPMEIDWNDVSLPITSLGTVKIKNHTC